MNSESTEQPSLDRDSFKQTIPLLAIKIPAKKCSFFMKEMRKEGLFNKPKLKSVVCDLTKHSNDERLVLLAEHVTDAETLEGLKEEHIRLIREHSAPVITHEIELGYEYLTAEQVLKKALPPDIGEITTSFETAGHIAHLNLRDHLLPYKKLIGQVILDKNPHVRTVVNKLHTIETQFRTFPMEVLAGAPDFEVELKEGGARFRFNFAEVYWNSRLQGEHARAVADVFAGVGPFAVPLALRGATVLANDLNPRSFHYLRENVEANRVANRVECSNLDGRAFLARVVARAAAGEGPRVRHLVMNLPRTAVEFLDALAGLDWAGLLQRRQRGRAGGGEEEKEEGAGGGGPAGGGGLPRAWFRVHKVREIAPSTPMLCLSFPVPLPAPPAAAASEAEGEGEGGASREGEGEGE
ncbi:unnamed protein product, partial [Heterosigma akashiwo]